MNRFFNMDNKFFVFMGRVADLLLLNFLCILCCIPVVTAGASITALYYVTLKMARDEESYIARSFFRSFKQNFKQATIINIIMLLTAAVLFIDLRIARAGSGAMYKGLFSLFIAFALIYAMILLYIYPILSKFFNSVKNTFVNAFLMSVRHLPLTLLMLVISADLMNQLSLSMRERPADVAFCLCELRTVYIHPDHALYSDGIFHAGLLEIKDFCKDLR